MVLKRMLAVLICSGAAASAFGFATPLALRRVGSHAATDSARYARAPRAVFHARAPLSLTFSARGGWRHVATVCGARCWCGPVTQGM